MALIVGLLFSFAVKAQDDDLPDRFAFETGGVSVFSSDTELASEAGMTVGRKIDFARDLGGGDGPSARGVAGYFRFNPHHRIDFRWYEIARNGHRTINRELRFRDAVFPVSARLNSSIDLEVGKLGYTWSFYHSDRVELGLTVGTHWIAYDFAMRAAELSIVGRGSINRLLPMSGARMDFAINDRWHLLFDIEWFSFKVSDRLRGTLGDLQGGLEYRPFRHIYFAALLNRLSVDARVKVPHFEGTVTDHYLFGQIAVGLRY